jgi:hypothetical protein
VVVDLAVHDDGDAPVLVEDRLVAAGHIDDREPLDPETDTSGEMEPTRIGPAMLHDPAHAVDGRGIHVPTEVDLACDTTHQMAVLEFSRAASLIGCSDREHHRSH